MLRLYLENNLFDFSISAPPPPLHTSILAAPPPLPTQLPTFCGEKKVRQPLLSAWSCIRSRPCRVISILSRNNRKLVSPPATNVSINPTKSFKAPPSPLFRSTAGLQSCSYQKLTCKQMLPNRSTALARLLAGSLCMRKAFSSQVK